MPEISNAQLNSYKRAEKVCRALRFYYCDERNKTVENYKIIEALFFNWFRNCKKIKYKTPKEIKETP